MKKLTYGDLRGERGLIAAVIAQAVRDVKGEVGTPGDAADAIAYFAGRDGTYRSHLQLLDLPGNWLPALFYEGE